jgi:hypothetical protein
MWRASLLCRFHSHPAKPAVSSTKFHQSFDEIFLGKIRPEPLCEMQFRVCAFPKEEVGKALLSTRADEKVNAYLAAAARQELSKGFFGQFG